MNFKSVNGEPYLRCLK